MAPNWGVNVQLVFPMTRRSRLRFTMRSSFSSSEHKKMTRKRFNRAFKFLKVKMALSPNLVLSRTHYTHSSGTSHTLPCTAGPTDTRGRYR
jgi:hypothetical protein